VPASATIELYGVREALRELQQIDPKLRYKAIAKIKAASGEMLQVAREQYPQNNDLQDVMPGWSKKGRLGYDKTAVDRGVQVVVGGRSRGNAYAIVTLVQKNAGGALFDIAGLRNGSSGVGSPDRLGRERDSSQSEAFLNNLTRAYGRAQRGLWRQVAKIRELATGELRRALDDVAGDVNRKLVA